MFQFFSNGGAVAYGSWRCSRSSTRSAAASPAPAQSLAPTLTLGDATAGIVFTGREPVDAHHRAHGLDRQPEADDPHSSGQPPGSLDLADMTIAYGDRAETFRRVTLNASPPAADADNTPEQAHRDRSPARFLSGDGRPSGDDSRARWRLPHRVAGGARPHSAGWRAARRRRSRPITRATSADAFGRTRPLDKIRVFNLLLTPGIWDPRVVSEALAMAERKRAFMVVDPPADAVADPTGCPLPMIGDIMSDNVPGASHPDSENGALYFPYLRSTDPATGVADRRSHRAVSSPA